MKKIAIAIICLWSIQASAQEDTSSLWSAGWGNVDYAVSESPAFDLLGISPDNILKPASARDITVGIGNYFLASGPVIPKGLSVEIVPWLLANSNASIYRYNKNLFIHRIRFSLGTKAGANGSYSVAEGLRFTIIDKADLKANKEFNARMQKILGREMRTTDYIEQHYLMVLDTMVKNAKVREKSNAAAHYFGYRLFRADYAQPDTTNPDLMRLWLKLENEISKRKKELLAANDPGYIAAMQLQQDENDAKIAIGIDSLEKLREEYKRKLWNAPMMELGIAVLQNSPDSLIKNMKVAQYGLWWNYGTHFGKNDQLLFGLNGKIEDSIKWRGSVSAGTRFYYGSNNIRAFVQAQYTYKNKMNSFTASAGCLFNIVEKLWGQALFSLVVMNNKVSFQPGFNIGLGSLRNNKTPVRLE